MSFVKIVQTGANPPVFIRPEMVAMIVPVSVQTHSKIVGAAGSVTPVPGTCGVVFAGGGTQIVHASMESVVAACGQPTQGFIPKGGEH